ncbi:4'-phosphopantetheinyl transferase family protein [Cytobacillus horneckiae]|uniref:4'-phosphopantetheinyl transferase family protein n=1 Tax=Cytobacillus horneckiae TaxID=549687 RepID=UPI00399FAF6B
MKDISYRYRENIWKGKINIGLLSKNDCHIWWAKLDTYKKNIDNLSEVELQRIGSLSFKKDKENAAVTFTFLRDVLALYTEDSPKSIKINRDCKTCGEPHGKPYLTGENQMIKFNISHTSKHVVIGLSLYEIGIDIENLNQNKDLDFLFSTLSENEKKTIKEEKKTLALLKYWTRKESIVKALGIGLNIDLSRLEVSDWAKRPYIIKYPDKPQIRHQMLDFQIEDMIGSITLLNCNKDYNKLSIYNSEYLLKSDGVTA